jgi:YD repeat-containing protein
VTETQRASGVDRVQFAYSLDAAGQPQTQVTDFSTGAPTSRTYNFIQQGRVLRPSGVSAPCPQCSSTAQSTQYDAAGNKIREVAHDGSVVFYKYSTRSLETERATFPASFAGTTTRPALSHATAVVSTQWHGTWNLPTRITEPQRNTTFSYNARGITATSSSATTDTTGAAKFSAVLTGPLSTTQYAYNANNLNTSVTELINNVQTQRWNLAYNTLGDLTSITDVTAGNLSATLTNDAQGRLTRIQASNGAVAIYTWNTHGQLATATMPGFTATLTYDIRKFLTEVGLNNGQWLRVTYSASGDPVSVLDSSGQVQQVSGLSTHWLRSDNPIGSALVLMDRSMQHGAQRLMDALLPPAFAQPIPLPLPPGIAAGLAASGGGALANRADQGPASSSGCCGGAGSISTRDVQERLQRTLPFTVMTAVGEVMQALTDDILTLRAGAQLRKRMQCSAEAYYQPLPPGCQEAHHIVAIKHPLANDSGSTLIHRRTAYGWNVEDIEECIRMPITSRLMTALKTQSKQSGG